VVGPWIYWKFRYSEVEGPATRLQTAEDLALRKEADVLCIVGLESSWPAVVGLW
jgi:hypothetical protein